jgi:hypothetical protein
MDNFTTNLIEKLKTVSFNSGNTKSANILYMLGVENKEVIICRLLASLIEPNGLHCLGIEPLKIFFKCINVNKKYSDNMLSNAMVETEELISDNRRVDIVIHIDNDVIPIEVKLYAKDQDAQLCDYFNYYKAIDKDTDKDIDKIYYLTIDGKEPSKSSVGNLKKENYSCISFFKEIYSFLSDLEELSTGAENDLIKIIKDFKEVISNLKSDEENMKEIVEKMTKCFEDNNNQVENEFLQIVKYSDEIWDEIRFLTLKNSIEEKTNNKYSLTREIKNKGELDFDTHCKYAITYDEKDEKDEKEVAYLAIDQNLYIVIKDKEERKNFEVENSNSDSKKYETNKDYVWKYIKIKDKKWDLRNVDPDISSHIKNVEWEKYIKF